MKTKLLIVVTCAAFLAGVFLFWFRETPQERFNTEDKKAAEEFTKKYGGKGIDMNYDGPNTNKKEAYTTPEENL